jgi:hypothetical protein
LDHLARTSRFLPKLEQKQIKKSSREALQSKQLDNSLKDQLPWLTVVVPMRLQAAHLHPSSSPPQKHHHNGQLVNDPHPRLVKSSYKQVLCHQLLDPPTSNFILLPMLPEQHL